MIRGVAFVLTVLAAALACGLELLEALAIVLAVALTRRGREALLGAGAAVLACGALAAVVGPALAAGGAGDALRLVVGAALLLFGLEWLRKGVLRLAGRRSRSDAFAEFLAEREALEAVAPPVAGRFDAAGFAIAFKGVLLEGIEVVLIVSVLAARPSGALPAILGAGIALIAVVALGAVLHRPLQRLPESELKLLVGLVLSTFGTFFAAEGMGVHWPLGDASLLLVLGAWCLVTGALVRSLAVGREGVAA
jgi:Ca2+/H+ antiporter, TMEM165/GDT1 family